MSSGPWKQVHNDEAPFRLRFRLWWGKTFYSDQGKTDSPAVLKIPSNAIIKFRSSHEEVEAMEFVRRKTSIPVPAVREKYERGDKVWVVMERVPGEPLDSVWGELDKSTKDAIVKQFGGYVDQLRNLEPPRPGFIGSISGRSGFDHSLGLRRFGPFESISDFHTYCRLATDVHKWENEPELARVHGRSESYKSVFAHGDLTPNNVLIKDGKITSIVDWECAGWYPEYWDYCKIHYGARDYRNDTYDAIDCAVKTYPEELAAMMALWRAYPPESYDDLLKRAQEGPKSGLSPEHHNIDDLQRLVSAATANGKH